jgi:hypothetical protein
MIDCGVTFISFQRVLGSIWLLILERAAFRGREFMGLPGRMLSALRHGGVYHPDPTRGGVTRHQPSRRVAEY